jgi:hypothetical protein
LKKSAKEMGLEKTVIFLGPRADVPDVLASFDVSVQCSLNENLGGTIESLLMARPTVATAVGGMIDSVRHGKTGLLGPPDDKQELAAAILNLLGNRQEARRLGQNGRRLMLREFTLAKTVDDIDRLYQISARKMLSQREPNPVSLGVRYYRTYRSLLNFCVLSVVLPIVFRRLGRIADVLITALAIMAALPVWGIMMLAIRLDSRAAILSFLRRTERFAQPLASILVHARAGRLDLTGLKRNLDGLLEQG